MVPLWFHGPGAAPSVPHLLPGRHQHPPHCVDWPDDDRFVPHTLQPQQFLGVQPHDGAEFRGGRRIGRRRRGLDDGASGAVVADRVVSVTPRGPGLPGARATAVRARLGRGVDNHQRPVNADVPHGVLAQRLGQVRPVYAPYFAVYSTVTPSLSPSRPTAPTPEHNSARALPARRRGTRNSATAAGPSASPSSPPSSCSPRRGCCKPSCVARASRPSSSPTPCKPWS